MVQKGWSRKAPSFFSFEMESHVGSCIDYIPEHFSR